MRLQGPSSVPGPGLLGPVAPASSPVSPPDAVPRWRPLTFMPPRLCTRMIAARDPTIQRVLTHFPASHRRSGNIVWGSERVVVIRFPQIDWALSTVQPGSRVYSRLGGCIYISISLVDPALVSLSPQFHSTKPFFSSILPSFRSSVNALFFLRSTTFFLQTFLTTIPPAGFFRFLLLALPHLHLQ